MCGLTGLWQTQPVASEQLAAEVMRMTDTLAHRGPDDSGVWTDPAAGLALGFRRLSIVDLTPEGHQPMQSPGVAHVRTGQVLGGCREPPFSKLTSCFVQEDRVAQRFIHGAGQCIAPVAPSPSQATLRVPPWPRNASPATASKRINLRSPGSP